MPDQAAALAFNQSQEGTAPAAGSTDRSTHFLFAHKLFSAKGAYFSLSALSDEPVFNFIMGELKASLTLPTLAREFELTPETDDGKLLAIVAKSLRFVKQIRPGDSIPRELLDGTSSWSVEPHHHEIARARLSVYLAAWVTGDDASTTETQVLQKIAQDPETQARVNKALGDLADKLGFGRDNKERVLDQLDIIGRELAFIEALRERYGKIKMIERKVAEAIKLYRRERPVLEDIQRVQVLLKPPLAEFPGIFTMIDWQTAEVTTLLRQMSKQITFIRTMRDDLHARFLKWEEMIQLWDPIPAERGEAIESAMRLTYRFLAHRFPQRSDWTLSTKG